MKISLKEKSEKANKLYKQLIEIKETNQLLDTKELEILAEIHAKKLWRYITGKEFSFGEFLQDIGYEEGERTILRRIRIWQAFGNDCKKFKVKQIDLLERVAILKEEQRKEWLPYLETLSSSEFHKVWREKRQGISQTSCLHEKVKSLKVCDNCKARVYV